MNFFEELQARGLIKSITDENLFKKLLDEKATIYAGFDPTATSLHIGHLVPVVMLSRFQKAGHRIIALVGGGTGLIGDPSGRNSARQLLTLQNSLDNAQAIKKQLSSFLDFSDINKTLLTNNYEWLHKINIIDYLRDFGSHFPVNYMLAKDTVASRLETGISYTEFSYMIIQSIDYLNLYRNENCRIQLGGSDQWGNITAGVELIHRLDNKAEVVGITLPLIMKSDGTKFGKSAGGALWLDSELTSPYEIYQYFLNTADNDVIHYLKVFTMLSLEEINEYSEKMFIDSQKREAQKRLASELVSTIHGKQALEEAILMSEALFNGRIKDLNIKQLKLCLNGIKSIEINEKTPLVDALVNVGACISKREAREFLTNGSITLNGDKIQDLNLILTKELAIENKLFVIRRGKKNYYMIQVAYE